MFKYMYVMSEIRDFLAILGRGPRSFLIGKISDINPDFGKFSEHSRLMFSKFK